MFVFVCVQEQTDVTLVIVLSSFSCLSSVITDKQKHEMSNMENKPETSNNASNGTNRRISKLPFTRPDGPSETLCFDGTHFCL